MTSFNYSFKKTTLGKKVWDQVFAIFKEKKFRKDATLPKKNLFFVAAWFDKREKNGMPSWNHTNN